MNYRHMLIKAEEIALPGEAPKIIALEHHPDAPEGERYTVREYKAVKHDTFEKFEQALALWEWETRRADQTRCPHYIPEEESCVRRFK